MCGKRSVPSDWSDAILIPIPKKGDLSHYNNWRGISLLNIIRKDVARTSKIGCRSWPRMSYPSRNVVLGRERLPGHNFHCMSVSGEVNGTQVQSFLHFH